MKLLERFTESKSAKEELNEDGIFFDRYFAAVIDGVTSKNEIRYGECSGGRFAAKCILSALETASPYMEPYEMICYLNNFLKKKINEGNYPYGASAGVVLYNDARKELISYGDNPYVINGNKRIFVKKSDVIAARKRSDVIKRYMDSGVSVDEIRANDPGRKEIVEFLKESATKFANKNVPDGYPVIDGCEIVESFIMVHKIESGSEIILASDGYPEIMQNLNDSEKMLKQLLSEDILCIDKLIGTKGVELGNVSYDDRSFLRFVT